MIHLGKLKYTFLEFFQKHHEGYITFTIFEHTCNCISHKNRTFLSQDWNWEGFSESYNCRLVRTIHLWHICHIFLILRSTLNLYYISLYHIMFTQIPQGGIYVLSFCEVYCLVAADDSNMIVGLLTYICCDWLVAIFLEGMVSVKDMHHVF